VAGFFPYSFPSCTTARKVTASPVPLGLSTYFSFYEDLKREKAFTSLLVHVLQSAKQLPQSSPRKQTLQPRTHTPLNTIHMAPVATNPLYANTSGFNTPESQLDGPVPLAPTHPTAARRPYSIVVNSENTTYSENFITSKYENRGASVVMSADGQVQVVPTVKSYEFRTAKKVQKTG